MILRIEKELFQWEKGRYVFVDVNEHSDISSIQFYNQRTKIAPEILVENGKAQIPNYLLKENLPIVAVACKKGPEGSQVIGRRVFKVLGQPKPEYYVDDDPFYPDEPGTAIDIIYDGGVEI